MKYKRKVFGRVWIDLGQLGKWKVEMHRDGLFIRRKHKRKVHYVSWPQLVDAAQGQMRLL